MAKSENKTKATAVKPKEFIASVEPEKKQQDAKKLLAFFDRVTGLKPVMWGPSIIGYGRYHYKYESGREGEFMITGFSPRKANLTIYVLPGYRSEQMQENSRVSASTSSANHVSISISWTM